MTSSLHQFLSGRPDPFVPGYRVLARAWDDLRTIVFSAEDLRTGARVLIKVPRSQHPSAQGLEQLRRDYEIGRSIESEHVVKPLAHLAHEGGHFMIVEDDGSRPIGESFDAGGLSLLPSLEFGVRLAAAVESLHRSHVIHRNLNPYSVWLHPRDSTIRITDFSLASNAAVEGPRLQSASRLEGDMRYISPEQTGRVNRAVDFRSDLYSMGVLMYQMLLGAPPFDSQDVLEVMHAHLARVPPTPHALNPAIPPPVSDIVMKLLSKAAEERYQSTRGLKADLEECLGQWRTRGTISGLAVGARDSSASFRVSSKLYGREDQLDFLLESFDRVCRGMTEVVVVSGPPGVGKSQLVKALQGRVRERGAFISSKFDQFKKNEPYSFIIQAFTELVTQILAEHDQRISHWKQRLTEALGANARVITEVIPEVELIIGPQAPIPELPAAEARNRFNRVLRQFVRVFARDDHPCSIFLDDLQWVDSASLNLVKILVTDPEVHHFQLIGAYRDTEVGDAHDVMLVLNQLRAANVEVRELRLACLDVDQVTDLLVDTLGCEPHDARPLAELVHQKTGGNPFFVNQFLLFLQQDELIQFDYRAGEWAWDLRRIWALGITDDVVELMNRKLNTLPASTREALKVAACLGNRFNLADIAIALEESVHVAFESVLAAMREGLIVAADGEAGEGIGERAFDHVVDDGSLRDTALRFLHDRVQQAAYALITPEDRPRLHFKIGKLLLASLSAEQREAIPFAILDNLNYGADLLHSAPEREEMARLNLLAGQRARESTAYQAALAYFRSGMRLLDGDSWSQHYELTMALHIERFECAYMTGSSEEANNLFRDVIANARTKPEKAKAYYLKILLTTSLDRSSEALALGFEGLRLFGHSLPANPSKLHLLLEMCKVIALLRGRRASDLLLLPRMRDPDRQATISLFMSICPPAYFRNTDLMALSALKIMSMSVRYGNTSVSPYGYAIYGLVRGAVFGDYKTGHEFGQLAAKLAGDHADLVQRCKVQLLFWGFVNYWRRPIEGSVSMLRETLKLALDCGELQYANYCILQIIFLSLARGANLDEVYAECTGFESFVKQTNDGFTIASQWIRKRGVLALKGSTLANDSLSDEEHSEDNLVEKWRSAGNLTTLSYYYIVKLQLGYLFGNYSSAYRFAQVSEAQIKEALSQICVAEHYFYWGLTAAALIRQQGKRDRTLWRRITRCCAKLRHWARNCPENFEHQYLLLEAEVASLRERTVDCERLYDRAIASAQSQGFSHVEGTANELAAHHYLKTRRPHIARVYFQAARAAFSRWGATAKVKQLDAEFQDRLVEPHGSAAEPQPKGEPPPAFANLIDVDLLMKASAELSAEIESERLLLRLLRLILESAGAQSGCFVADEDGQLRVEIACLGDGNQTAVLRALPVDDAHLSGQIVRYVLRTGQQLVLDDATTDVRFANCPYIRSARPRSVLCAPLSKNAKVIGALYLENRLTPGAFTAERLPSLRLLSQQAVLAIENATYYRKLKLNNDALQAALHKVEILERVRTHLTKFVPQSLQRLIEANPEQPDLEVHDEDVSIVFLDIAGYTRMSESVDSQQVGTLVETYFSSFLDIINSNRGDVNEVLGDGLMVIFRHPDPAEHPVLAARAALGIRDRTKQLNAALRGTWPPVTINIGINSGIVSLGAKKIQSTLGTRWTYAATGSVTNLAARIGASATNGAILVSEVTARRMAGRFELLDLGPQRFKGVAKPIAISRIVDERAEQRP